MKHIEVVIEKLSDIKEFSLSELLKEYLNVTENIINFIESNSEPYDIKVDKQYNDFKEILANLVKYKSPNILNIVISSQYVYLFNYLVKVVDLRFNSNKENDEIILRNLALRISSNYEELKSNLEESSIRNDSLNIDNSIKNEIIHHSFNNRVEKIKEYFTENKESFDVNIVGIRNIVGNKRVKYIPIELSFQTDYKEETATLYLAGFDKNFGSFTEDDFIEFTVLDLNFHVSVYNSDHSIKDTILIINEMFDKRGILFKYFKKIIDVAKENDLEKDSLYGNYIPQRFNTNINLNTFLKEFNSDLDSIPIFDNLSYYAYNNLDLELVSVHLYYENEEIKIKLSSKFDEVFLDLEEDSSHILREIKVLYSKALLKSMKGS